MQTVDDAIAYPPYNDSRNHALVGRICAASSDKTDANGGWRNRLSTLQRLT